jgi:hypothetical protein
MAASFHRKQADHIIKIELDFRSDIINPEIPYALRIYGISCCRTERQDVLSVH